MAQQNTFVLPQVVSYQIYPMTQNIYLPQGTGAFKLGVNYAPGILPQKAAASLGYAQNLWLHGPEHYLTEVRDRS